MIDRQTDRQSYLLGPWNSIGYMWGSQQHHIYMISTIKIASFDIIKWYMGRETPIKANNVAALIGATLE